MTQEHAFIRALVSLACISAAGLAPPPAGACESPGASSKHDCDHHCRHQYEHPHKHHCKHSVVERGYSGKVYELQAGPKARITTVSVDYSSGGADDEIGWACNGKEVARTYLDNPYGKEVTFDYTPYKCKTIAVRVSDALGAADILGVRANIEALDAQIPTTNGPPPGNLALTS